MPLTAKHYLILLLIILCGFALRTHKALQFNNIEHDDQISLLAATGHLGEYVAFTHANTLAPSLHTARDWQQLLHADPDLTLFESAQVISADLQAQDIHPPLYFIWLNRVVDAVDDVTPRIGWISNAGFFVLNAVLLFALGLRLLRDPQQALLATFIWSLSSAAILGSIVARHYEWLTLFTLLSTLALLPSLRSDTLRPGWMILYGGILFCGFLANYQFLYHVAALSLLVLIAHHRQPIIVMLFAVLTLATIGLALLTYPALLNQTHEVADWNAHVTHADILFRIRNTTEDIAKYCIVGTLVLLVLLVKKRHWLTQIDHRIGWLALINLLALAGVYLAFISPRHAMGGRYMASAGPFLSLFFAAVLFAFWQHKMYRYCVLLLVLMPALLLAKKPTKTAAAPTALREASLVVADFDSRGVWPGIFMQLKPEQSVLVASQDYWLTHTDWPALLANQTAVWVSDRSAKGNSDAKQQQLLEAIQTQMSVDAVETTDRGLRYYRIRPRP